MREELLQFIWRWQYFNPHELLSETGEVLQVLSPGELNVHQGPDFLHAQVRIGGVLLVGSVELHIAASDWDRHAHTGDSHYRNVILHVVWENDLDAGVPIRDGEDAVEAGKPAGVEDDDDPMKTVKDIPMLVLQHRISKPLLGQYELWMKSRVFVPCERQLSQAGPDVWAGWKQELLLRRLQRRAMQVGVWLEQNRRDWEETTWWLLARNFGLTVNGAAFEAIARSLPIRMLARYRGDLFRLEALLLGQAGLLGEGEGRPKPEGEERLKSEGEGRPKPEGEERLKSEGGDFLMLQREYRYLQRKYQLMPIQIPPRFFRMRPAHFPTVRLAQLASLLSEHTGWFTAILEADSPADLDDRLQAAAGSYGAKDGGKDRTKKLGEIMRNSIRINTFIPLLYAYGSLQSVPVCRERALRWLREAKAEKNTILTGWMRLGVANLNAADSQALLELKGHYCDAKKCLDCAIGKLLLGKTGSPDGYAGMG
ncbi:MAG TPA: DUF2851 family protein [Puia sp.]